MCLGGSPPQDNSAELARQKEAEREARIREGRAQIDETFGQFGDPFFQEREQAYLGYYEPQLEDQYEKARRQMVMSLARSGNLNAGAGARKLGGLKEDYTTRLGELSGKAIDFSNQTRNEVENTKQELYSQNRASADPSSAAAAALARAGTLSTAPSFSPLGAMFADATNNAANVVAMESRGYPGFRTGLFDVPASTTRVVK